MRALVLCLIVSFTRSDSLTLNHRCSSHLQKSMGKYHLSLRGGSTADYVPELKPPPALYQGAVSAGAAKASQSPLKILLLGILAGCHIG